VSVVDSSDFVDCGTDRTVGGPPDPNVGGDNSADLSGAGGIVDITGDKNRYVLVLVNPV